MRRRPAPAVFAAACLAGAVSAAVLLAIQPAALLLYGDAASRLVLAREFVDSADPGLHRLGTVWLPLPYFLLLPPALVESLFRSGLAGALVGLPCLAGAASYVFALVLRFGRDRRAAWIAAASVALNPNLVYLSLCAMTEAPALLFLAAAAWHTAAGLQFRDGHSPRNLLMAALAVAAGTLTRYEFWPLAVLWAPAVTFAAWRGAGVRPAALCAALISVTGILGWLLFHRLRYGDAFFFARAPIYSAVEQSRGRSVRGMLRHHPAAVAAVFGAISLLFYGPLASGIFRGPAFLWRRGAAGRGAMVLLAVPPAFVVLCLHEGMAEMVFRLNTRYVALLAPLLAVLLGCRLAAQSRMHRGQIPAVLVSAFLFFAALAVAQRWQANVGIVAWSEADHAFHLGDPGDATRVGQFLRGLPPTGRVALLTGYAQGQRIMIACGPPLSRFEVCAVDEPGDTFTGASLAGVSWVVVAVNPGAESAEPARLFTEHRARWGAGGAALFRNAGYAVYAGPETGNDDPSRRR